MDHGGEAARSATVQGSEANIGTGLLSAAAARRASFEPTAAAAAAAAYHDSAESVRHVVFRAAAARGELPAAVFHREPRPGAAYANIGEFRRQPGPVGVVLLRLRLPDGVILVLDSPFYSALQPRPGAGHGEVLVDLHPGDAFLGQLPGGVDAVYENYGYHALQPRPSAGHGEVLVYLLPDGAGHGEVFVDLLPGGDVAVHDDYAWQPRPGAGRGEPFIGLLSDGVGVVFDNSGNFAQQTLLGTGRADGITGALRDTNLGEGYDNRGVVAERLHRLLPFVGIGASSVAVNGLAAGPGSPAVAFHLFALLLGGLFLVILHVLRV